MNSIRSETSRHGKSILRWALVAVWMVLIFIGSSLHGNDLPEAPELVSVIVHFFEYFVLTILLLWAINKRLSNPIDAVSSVSAFFVAGFYGVTDELHQIFVPGRIPDMFDLFVDTLGAFAAILIISVIAVAKKRKAGKKSN